METLAKTLAHQEGGQHETGPEHAATLLEYLRGAGDAEGQLARAREVCETINAMLTYDTRGRLTGILDSSYLEVHGMEHLGFVYETRALYEEIQINENETVEDVLDADERVQALLKNGQKGPPVRAVRTLKVAELVEEELSVRLGAEEASA